MPVDNRVCDYVNFRYICGLVALANATLI